MALGKQLSYNAGEKALWISSGERKVKLALISRAIVEGKELVLMLKDDDVVRVECTSKADAEKWLSMLDDELRKELGPKMTSQCSRISSIESLASHVPSDETDLTLRCSLVDEDDDDDAMTNRSSTASLLTPPLSATKAPKLLPNFFQSKQPRVKPIKPIDAEDLQKPPSHCCDHHHDLGCTMLTEFLFIGGRAIASDKQAMDQRGITHVVNMTKECDNFFEQQGEPPSSTKTTTPKSATSAGKSHHHDATHSKHHKHYDFSSGNVTITQEDVERHQRSRTCDANCLLCYLRCECTDKSDDDMGPFLDVIADFINAARQNGGKVLVHCNSGISRSSAAVLAFVVKYGFDGSGCALIDALRWLRDRRRIASPHPTYMRQLCDFEVQLRGGTPSINSNTYANNRYEDVENLHASLADPRSTANLLGDKARPQDMSPVYDRRTTHRFPSAGTPSNKNKVAFLDFNHPQPGDTEKNSSPLPPSASPNK